MIFAVSTRDSIRVWIDAGATVVIAAIAGIYALLRYRLDRLVGLCSSDEGFRETTGRPPIKVEVGAAS
jgi:hypothetical protein